ncbi:MAG: ribosomal protein S18 acetylase RimI-like enzyme [Halieaceae bacterium]|jgi:ribosomal protein S18 acetylase RimI-like enzyme
MIIREYLPQDLDAVITLWSDCGRVVPYNSPERDIERKMKVDPDLFLVGIDGGELVAIVMGGYEGRRGWINYLAVIPFKQRRSYGRLIMNAVEARIERKGCAKINLQIRSTNKAVVAFYQSLGYRIDDVTGMGKRLDPDD